MKVNIACGLRKLNGWINVDCRQDVNPDVLADVRKMPFKDGEVEEAWAHSVLEHFSKWELKDVLKEWARIMKKGGKITISVPDMRMIATHLLASSTEETDHNLINLVYGEQNYKENLHKWGYTEKSLKRFLEEAGFENVVRLPAQRYSHELFVTAIKK